MMTDACDVLIVGGGHAGANVVAALRQMKFTGSSLLVSDEGFLPYHRPPLSKGWLTGSMQEKQLPLFPESLYDRAGCTLRLSTRITEIDRTRKYVRTTDGDALHYNKLVLATGGTARRLPIPGADDPRIGVLRTRADSEALRARLVPGQHLVVIGGGYIGLEVAASARKLGCAVTLLEAEARVLARVTCAEASAFYQQVHHKEGVDILTSAAATAFTPGDTGLAVHTTVGDLTADSVLVGVGLVPDILLAAAAGLCPDGDMVVDAYCRTPDPDIYAIGDMVKAPIPLYGGAVLRVESVQNAVDQARTVAAHITGTPVVYDPVPWFWSDQYDLKLKIAGLSHDHDSVVVRGDPAARAVSFCYLKDGRLVAVDAVNRAADFVAGQKLIRQDTAIDPGALADANIALKTLLSQGQP